MGALAMTLQAFLVTGKALVAYLPVPDQLQFGPPISRTNSFPIQTSFPLHLVCLLNGFSRRGHIFLRVVSKIHGHYMERFSHWETGLDKYAISWELTFERGSLESAV